MKVINRGKKNEYSYNTNPYGKDHENITDYIIGNNGYTVICMTCVNEIKKMKDYELRKEEVFVGESEVKWL